jgi:hypothetical protein
MKRDYPLSTTPNPSSYTGGKPSEKKEVGFNRTVKEKEYKNLAGDTVTKSKVTYGRDEDGKKVVAKYKLVRDEKTGIESKRKTKLNRESPDISDMVDLRKGVSKTNFDRNTGVATSRKQKDKDWKIGYGDTGMMAKTNNYSKDRAKEVLKSVGSAVKKVVSRKK